MKKYILSGLAFFGIEIFLYEIGYKLSVVWYSHVNSVEAYPNFCKVRDVVGNCLDFPWHNFFVALGLFGIKMIVLVLFFVLLFKQKKVSNALYLVAFYSIPISVFHLGLINMVGIGELCRWLEIANVFGMLSVIILVIISLLVSSIFSLYNRFQKKKPLHK
jgi:hypothetical protein